MSQTHNPFPGLRPYDRRSSRRFAGRERLVGAVLEATRAHRCLTLSGPAISGKSSVVLAGVAAAAEAEGWQVLTVRGWDPSGSGGSGPSAMLMAAAYEEAGLPREERGALADVAGGLSYLIRRGGVPALLILDQLEQLLIHHDPRMIGLLADQLATLARHQAEGLHLIMIVGEDLLPQWEEHIAPHDALTRGRMELPPPTIGEAATAVIATASAGVPPQSWAPAAVRPIVERLIIPGQLTTDSARVEAAYVQLVFSALFDRGLWDPADPGVAPRLLAEHLRASLEGLGPLEAQARALLEQRAVSASGDIRPMTPSIAREVVADERALEEILRQLCAQRILRRSDRRGEQLYELGHVWFAHSVHEAAEVRRRARLQLQSEKAARRRRSLVAVAGALLLGVAAVTTGLYLRAQSALDASVKAREALEITTRRLAVAEGEARDLARATQKTNRQLRERQDQLRKQQTRLAEQTATAQAERARAEAQSRRAADALRMAAAAALVPTDPTLAALFLREVGEPGSVPGWRELATRALQDPLAWVVLQAPGDGVSGPPAEGEPPTPAVILARLSSRGDLAYAALADGRNTLWRLEGGVELRYLPSSASLVTAAAILGEGDQILIAEADAEGRGSACLWHRSDATLTPERGRPELCLEGHTDAIVDAAIDPAGRLMATASRDATAALWSAQDGRRLCEMTAHLNTVNDVTFQADGRRLATASADGSSALWGAGEAACDRIAMLGGGDGGHRAGVTSILLSPDASFSLTTSSDGTARLWPLGRNAPPLVFRHLAPVTAAAFSADGRLAFTGAGDGAVRMWRLPGGELIQACPVGEPISSLTVFQRAPVEGAEDAAGPLTWIAGTSAGDLVVGEVQPGDACPPRGALTRLRGPTDAITSVEVSRDGQTVLSVSAGGDARIWRLGDGSAALPVEEAASAAPRSAPRPAPRQSQEAAGAGRPADPEIQGLLDQLFARTSACLAPGARIRWLRERADQASAGWQRCMAQTGRR